VAPPASTNYRVDDGQVVVPPDASERLGVQPVVSLTVDDGERAAVPVGGELTFRAVAEVPPGTGAIVAVEWDFDGSGHFSEATQVEPAARVDVEQRVSFAGPGTRFPAVRVVSQRAGSATTPYARLQNLARVRVVVGDPPEG
jgi:hypothetical protein